MRTGNCGEEPIENIWEGEKTVKIGKWLDKHSICHIQSGPIRFLSCQLGERCFQCEAPYRCQWQHTTATLRTLLQCFTKPFGLLRVEKKAFRVVLCSFYFLIRKFCIVLIKWLKFQHPNSGCHHFSLPAVAFLFVTTRPWASFSSKTDTDWSCHILGNWKQFRLEVFKIDLWEFRLQIPVVRFSCKVIEKKNFLLLSPSVCLKCITLSKIIRCRWRKICIPIQNLITVKGFAIFKKKKKISTSSLIFFAIRPTCLR